MGRAALIAAGLAALALAGCKAAQQDPGFGGSEGGEGAEDAGDVEEPDADPLFPDPRADVLDVIVSGEPGAYTFSVTIRSDETGCDEYADWWEVVSQDGELLYRRILEHSHADEQPFTRAGGPVPIGEKEGVIVRAHMSTTGYLGRALIGSAKAGWKPHEAPSGFAAGLASQPPLPASCAF